MHLPKASLNCFEMMFLREVAAVKFKVPSTRITY
jgi:hypothetical protein